MKNKQILNVKNLTKQHQPGLHSGIKDISFDVFEGEIVAIIGESGSGKSTLLKSIYGLLKLDEGEVIFNGKRVKGPDEQLIPGHAEMKMVTQDFSLNIYAKVYDNIASMLPNTNVALKEQKTLEMLDNLHITHLKNKRIVELSGGEQQRVAIARALVSDTKVLLLDEPFSQVDSILKSQLRADIKRLAEKTGLTIILVSHDAGDGLSMADRLIILKDGMLLQNDQPKTVYEHPNHYYTAKILGNAVVLNTEQANKLSIGSKAPYIAFYPEWVKISKEKEGILFTVKDVQFKGFYEELILEKNGIHIRSVQFETGIYKKNDHVYVNIGRFLEF